ncbi:MAG: hypothetical protein FD189_1588 [Elusimicrobia bacterium]|nr:MAG: hypothetical protein FD154_1075 [Elusimicrobiota bacterium]KAF0154998.1 MAG: hypothetical protein FD189_1588 [Elusimicrobiota bacterium]
MSEKKETGAQPIQLQVEMDDTTAQGIYANLAGVTHSETEFIFDFLFLQPNQPKAKLRARIVSSPVHTKRFLMALTENIKRYEERFGPISDRAVSTTQGHS